MSTSERVLRRFMADAIADPKVALEKFKTWLNSFSQGEVVARADLPKLHAYNAIMSERGPNGTILAPEKLKPIGDDLMKTNRERHAIMYELRSGNWFHYGRSAGAHTLFWALLQQYMMAPSLRKAIEGASRFWSKTRVLAPRIKSRLGTYDAEEEYLTAYLKLLADVQKQAMNAEAAIAKGQLHSDPEVAAKTKIHVGSFDLVNTGGFDDKTMQRVVEVVGKAEKAMTEHGLGKVCYGDILVSQTIRSKKTIAAFYMLSSDEMFIRANTPDEWDTVKTVCHELGHRLQTKFLHGKTAAIRTIYTKLLSEQSTARWDPPKGYPKPGDTGEYKGHQVVLRKIDLHRQKIEFAEVKPMGEAASVYTAPVGLWFKLKGIDPHMIEDYKGFVTKYASTDPDENFAEMVAYYVTNRLPKPQIPLLEAVLFGDP